MRIHDSIRNSFLGVVFLSILILPNVAFAKIDVPGDTTNSLNSNSTGTGYYANRLSVTGENITYVTGKGFFGAATIALMDKTTSIPIKQRVFATLYNPVQTRLKPTAQELDALKAKLKEDGSPVDVDKLTTDNVTLRNTPDVTMFVFDKTMGDATNNDSVYIGYATKHGEFYTDTKPSIVESAEGDKKLGIIDAAQGRPVGTTVTAKNDLYSKTQEEKLLQEKLNADAAAERIAEAQMEEAYKSGDQDAITRATLALEAARRSASTTQSLYDQSLAARIAAQNAAAASARAVNDGSCSTIWMALSLDCLMFTIAKILHIIFKLISFIAYIAGTLFDYSLELSINSAEFFKKLGVVEITWSFIRDILNMSFIFILLWTAIQILIGNDAKYSAKKTLINVIIVAILMNFSLFAAKIMVDGSNIVSLKIYEAMKANTGQPGASISARIMNTVGLTTLYDITKIFNNDAMISSQGSYCAQNNGAMITISVMGSIFLIILILAMGLAAILFLIRLVNIIVLFIKSPLWVWGYVMPGNATITRFKDEWWREMKHVLLFPIAYLFWMLVAIIIFTKLGSTVNGGVSATGVPQAGLSLLDIICKPPDPAVGGLGQSISLVAIFAIVIIFMMKAIEYGIKNVSGGGEGAIGNNFGASMAKKFGGYQNAMTRGLMKKAITDPASAIGGASIGLANRGLMFAKDKTAGGIKRTGGMFVGGAAGMLNGDGVRKGVAEGFINPDVYRKEQLAKLAGRAALLTGSKTLASYATKNADPKNSDGKTRKEVYEERTKSQKEAETMLQAISAKEFKIQTQEEWEKKNGKIGTDMSKATEYQDYVKKQIEKRGDASLGKGILGYQNASHVKHLDAISNKAIKQDIERDSSGNITGIKVKVSNQNIESELADVLKYHTTGEGVKKIDKKGVWKPFRTKGAAERVKVAQKAFRENAGEHGREEIKKRSEEASREKLKNIPEDAVLDDIVKNTTKNKLVGNHEKVKEVREINGLIDQYRNAIRAKSAAGTSATQKLEAEEKMIKIQSQLDDKVSRLKDTRDSIRTELDKKEAAK